MQEWTGALKIGSYCKGRKRPYEDFEGDFGESFKKIKECTNKQPNT